MSIAVLAGLGNPGEEYAETRHNVGFQVLDALARREGLAWTRDRHCQAMVAKWVVPGRPVCHLVKPLTYMNESGLSLRKVCDFFRVPHGAVTAVYDDLNLDVGRLKLSVSGSAGGHNGVQSLLDHLGDGFVRFRIGIGPRRPAEIDLKDFVLGKFPASDQQIISSQISNYLAGLDLLLQRGLEPAMNQLNRRPPSSANEPNQPQV